MLSRNRFHASRDRFTRARNHSCMARLGLRAGFALLAILAASVASYGAPLPDEATALPERPAPAAATPQQRPAPAATPRRTDPAAAVERQAPAAAPVPLGDKPSPEAMAVLKKIQQSHGNLKTLKVKFDQLKVSEVFGDKIESQGELYLETPNRLRCDYSGPDPSTIIFVERTLQQYFPAIKQVDKFVYATDAEARQQFNLVLLGFGMSGEEISERYHVKLEKPDSPEHLLSFKPKDADIARTYAEFRVWIDPQRLLPSKVRIEEVSGDVTTLTITEIIVDEPISGEKFEAKFPKDVEIVEHNKQG